MYYRYSRIVSDSEKNAWRWLYFNQFYSMDVNKCPFVWHKWCAAFFHYHLLATTFKCSTVKVVPRLSWCCMRSCSSINYAVLVSFRFTFTILLRCIYVHCIYDATHKRKLGSVLDFGGKSSKVSTKITKMGFGPHILMFHSPTPTSYKICD